MHIKYAARFFTLVFFVVVVVVVVVFAFLYPREEVIEQKKKVAKQLHAKDNTKSVKQHNTIIHTYKSRGKKKQTPVVSLRWCGVVIAVLGRVDRLWQHRVHRAARPLLFHLFIEQQIHVRPASSARLHGLLAEHFDV